MRCHMSGQTPSSFCTFTAAVFIKTPRLQRKQLCAASPRKESNSECLRNPHTHVVSTRCPSNENQDAISVAMPAACFPSQATRTLQKIHALYSTAAEQATCEPALVRKYLMLYMGRINNQKGYAELTCSMHHAYPQALCLTPISGVAFLCAQTRA